MACPLLDKLPPELRTKIYEYVLYFDDVPLRHITQLQPFVKKLTGFYGELPFSYEDPKKRDPELEWIMCEDDGFFGNLPADTGVLLACKTVYTEAIKVFYSQTTISVDVELFKLAAITSPTASDLSLAKRLHITFNSSCDELEQYHQAFNTLNIPNLLTHCAATFPSLQSIAIHTDGTTLPSTSLFDMYVNCHNSPRVIKELDFPGVGYFVASTHSGITLTVKFKALAELWEETSELSSRSNMRALPGFGLQDDSLARYTHQAFLTRTVFEHSGDGFTRRYMDNFRQAMAAKGCQDRERLQLNDHAYWTHVASEYSSYDDDPVGIWWS